MHSKEKQVEQLLVNANQSLNFLRIILDDLIVKSESLSKDAQQQLFIARRNYRMHKAVLINTNDLLSGRKLPLPERLATWLANSLRKRIANIIEEAIEMDRLR